MNLHFGLLISLLVASCAAAEDSECQNGKLNRDGVCKCRKGYTGKHCQIGVRCCLIYGDPHILTFDGGKINYMGACAYQMAGVCPCVVLGEQKESLPEFNVIVDTWRKGKVKSAVSWTRSVAVQLHNHTVKIGQKMAVYVNDAKVTLPYAAIPHAHIEHTGDYIRVSTEFGASVQFDGVSRALICVPKHWEGRTCGICGNNNGNKRDDYVTRDGTDVSRQGKIRDVMIGNSWRDTALMDKTVCEEEQRQIQAAPSPGWLKKAKSKKHCGYIVDRAGPFSKCIIKLGNSKIMSFYEECMFDVYESRPDHVDAHASACGFLSALMTECEEVDAYPETSWRRLTDCKKRCPKNFVYSFEAPACPATCGDPDAPRACEEETTEGCVCAPGLLLADGECVKPEECGCTDRQGSYHKVKSAWYDEACTSRYRCTVVGDDKKPQILSEPACAENETCKPINGVVTCVKKPKKGGWGAWGEWSDCEPYAENEGFVKTRVRMCNNPVPENEGTCEGESYQSVKCAL